MTGALAGQVALIAGASRGLGAAVARELARQGAHIVALARTEGALSELDDALRAEGTPATLVVQDLAEGAALDALGPTLHARFGRLDILIDTAAALGALAPVAHILPKDWEEAVAVNLTATWRLIRSCAPLLLAAPAGRAVFLSCGVATAPLAYWGALAATLAGREALVRAWAAETTTTRLRVNLADPGPMATRLRRAAFPGEAAAPSPPRRRSLPPWPRCACRGKRGTGRPSVLVIYHNCYGSRAFQGAAKLNRLSSDRKRSAAISGVHGSHALPP